MRDGYVRGFVADTAQVIPKESLPAVSSDASLSETPLASPGST
jgi:hypothetical protein